MKTKQGSALSSIDEEAFNAPLFLPTRIEPAPSEKHEAIKEELIKFTNKMMKLLQENKCDEVQFVQPNTFQFYREICRLYLSDYDLRLVNRSIDQTSTEYSTTMYCTDNEEMVKIKGETDSTLLYCGVPVATWEDKRLDFDLLRHSARAQALAEVKGNSQRFRNCVKEPARQN